MTDDNGEIRASVLAADRGFQVVLGGRGDDRPPPFSGRGDAPPIMALGHLDGKFWFLDINGQPRGMGARQLGSRHELLSLFLGDDEYLRKRFPKTIKVKDIDARGQATEVEKVVDFRINAVVQWLQAECGQAGLYGDHIQLRRPGVWPEADGLPAVHCGDMVLIGSSWQSAGYRRGNQIWAAAPATARPALPCPASIGRELKEQIAKLWNFRRPGGELMVMGMLGSAYYGAAAPWRPSGFLTGGAGCGKSSLLAVLRAASPIHVYSNDTSKSGLEQVAAGRAMPMFIDEASDREDQRGARALLDLVLSAAGGEGTKGHRGGVDGTARRIEVVGSFIMASILPPDMQAQHLGRFTLVEMTKPQQGVDYSNEHKELAQFAAANGPGLWGRAIAGWHRYTAALRMFRASLKARGCAPREMDQLGALLAGHWILTEEGEPGEIDGAAGVRAVMEFIRDSDEITTDDTPRRMMNHLLSTMVMLDRSSSHEPIATLVRSALHPGGDEVASLKRGTHERFLGNYGMRVIRANDTAKDRRGRSAPRAADGAGVWFHTRHAQLQRIFDGTPWAGDRWLWALRGFESARTPKMTVRIGDMDGSRCVWVGAEELGFHEDDME